MLSFSSSKVVDVQRHDVHRSTANSAWTHVSIHAQLPSMVFSFPTNHVIPWLFKSFLCQSQRPKQSQDTEKPHRKWSLRDFMYHVLPPIYSGRREPIPSATFNTWQTNTSYSFNRREHATWNKTNLLFSLGLLKLAKCSEYLYTQKAGSIWRSICWNILIQDLNSCSTSLCHGYMMEDLKKKLLPFFQMKYSASLSHQQYIAGRESQAYLNTVDTHSNTVGGSVHVGYLAIFELQPSYFCSGWTINWGCYSRPPQYSAWRLVAQIALAFHSHGVVGMLTRKLLKSN